ncbi:MAG: hypothetical protein LBS51_07030 [Oscillospiraceae bacterium]|jgi:hypothetical protein|nr:hypothetical protein [Oscillospiraceae bacterium]
MIKQSLKRKTLSILLSLAMVVSLLSGLGITAGAAPPSIGAGTHITAPGPYQIDPGAINGTIYVDVTGSTGSPIILIGNGTAQGDTPNSALTIECTVPGVTLELQNLYVSSPYSGGAVIDFIGVDNTLSVTDGYTAILESNGYGDAAVLHVGKGSELTITGTASSYLYLYKSSTSAAIGGNTGESSGAITFASGNTFVKGTQIGATIGGDDATGATTNDDITISGGLLCVETNARGAGIGASNQGECAGNVFVTGGSTLINVNFTGSAIGRGESGATVGDLFISGGSLKVVVNPNAGGSWPGGAGVNNAPITANIHYGTPANPQHGNVAEVDVSSLNIAGNLTAVFNPDDQSPRVVYDQAGLNQYDYAANQDYTPANWSLNAVNTNLYLYGPESTTGYIAVSDASGATQNYGYNSSNPATSSYFTLTPTANDVVSFFADNATVSIGGTRAYYALVASGTDLTFDVAANTGFTVTDVSDNGVSIGSAAGSYTLSNVTTNHRIVVTTQPAPSSYTVSFNAPNATVYVNGQPVTSATIAAGGTLDFTVVPDTGYTVTGVTASNGTVTSQGAGIYELSDVTANTTVTVVTVAQIYTVSFSGGSDQVRVNGVSTTSANVVAGGTLNFTVVPDLGYDTNEVTANGNIITPNPQGVYTLSDVQTDYTVVVTTEATDDYWTKPEFASPDWASGSGTAASPYLIADYTDSQENDYTSANVLAKLLQDVNSGTSYADTYFLLGGNVDLSDNHWAPIGGGRDLYNGVPLGNYFAGHFDGGGYTISGIDLIVSETNVNAAGYGLFGRIDGGTVQNLTIDGSIHTDYNNNAVAGLVGYTNGNITNVINKAEVTVLGAGVSQTAGIAAVAENLDTTTVLTISDCANLGAIRGRSRLGGIVGAAYCAAQDGTVIENSYNAGSITAGNGTGTAYVGGVVGYCVGKIAHVYNTGDVSTVLTGTRFFVGGVAGLLNGGGVFGSMSDSYNAGSVSSVSTLGDVEPLYATADNSPNVVISNCVYVNDDGQVQDQLGATWTAGTVNGVAQSFLQSQSVLNASTYLDPGYFDQYGIRDPVLDWQVAVVNDGTVSSFNAAVNTLTAARYIVAVNASSIAVESDQSATINLAGVNGVIVRGNNLTTPMFTVSTGGVLSLVSGVIDGAASGGAVSGAPTVVVGGGIFNIDGGTIQNSNTSVNGGAIAINSGTVNMTGGTISGNTAALGNGIYVSASNQLTLSPSGAGAITFGANDAIYLPNSAGTVAGQVSFNIGAVLGTGVTGNVPLAFQTPLVNAVVAIATDGDVAFDSYETLYSPPRSFDISPTADNEIIVSAIRA